MSDSFDTTLRWEMPVPSQRTLAAPWRRQLQPVAVSAATPAPVAMDGNAWEQKAIAIIVRSIVNESAAAGHARKEAELKDVFATLSVSESRALHARLVSPKAGDELARLIGRMMQERRERVIAFLAGARRREAIAMTRAAEMMAKRCG